MSLDVHTSPEKMESDVSMIASSQSYIIHLHLYEETTFILYTSENEDLISFSNCKRTCTCTSTCILICKISSVMLA
jgi:hypothetical protein